MLRLPSRVLHVLEYEPRIINSIADAISQKYEFIAMVSHPLSFLLDRIKEGLAHDPMTKNIMKYSKEGKTQRFWLEGDLLYTKERRLYVLLFENIRREILRECYDSQWAGHPVYTVL